MQAMNDIQPSQSSQYYFLHLPKTAGSSLRDMLRLRFAERDIFPIERVQVLQQTPKAEIQKYKLFCGHFDYQFVYLFPVKPNIITVLRDPVERVLSNYSFWRENYLSKGEVVTINGVEVVEMVPEEVMLPLEDFIESDYPQIWDEVNNSQAARLAHSLGWRRENQVSEDELWKTASQNLDTIDAVGTVENFSTFLEVMCSRFSWVNFEESIRTNVTKNRVRSGDIDPNTIQRIKEKNQIDVALHAQASEILRRRKEDMQRRYFLMQLAVKTPRPVTVTTSHPIQNQQIDFAVSGPVIGRNWFPREQIGWEFFIWSGPASYSNIFLVCAVKADHWFEITLPMVVHPSVVDDLQLTANRYPIEFTRVIAEYSTPQRYILTGQIPAEAVMETDGGFLIELGFEVRRTYSPMELRPESTDTRQLGIAVSHVRLRPVRSAPQPMLANTSFARLDALVARLQKGQRMTRLDWRARPPALPDGWFEPETDAEAGAVFAWTGPGTRSTVEMPLPPGTSFLIELDLHSVMDEAQVAGLKLSIDGEPLRLVRGVRHGLAAWLCAEWQAATSDPERIVTLTLDVPHVVIPRDVLPDSADIRPLGVAVRDIRISAQPTLDPR
jgi:hypothetical protein